MPGARKGTKASKAAADKRTLRAAVAQSEDRDWAPPVRRAVVGTPRTPEVGDPVWYGTKMCGCIITTIKDGAVLFQGGPIIKNRKGREVPRWTVVVRESTLSWNPEAGWWVYGQPSIGTVPEGIVVRPVPAALSGTNRGTFANG